MVPISQNTTGFNDLTLSSDSNQVVQSYLDSLDDPEHFLKNIEAEIISDRITSMYDRWTFQFLCSDDIDHLDRYNYEKHNFRVREILTRNLFKLFSDWCLANVDIDDPGFSRSLSAYLKVNIGIWNRFSNGRWITVFPTLNKARKRFAQSKLLNSHFDWGRYEVTASG